MKLFRRHLLLSPCFVLYCALISDFDGNFTFHSRDIVLAITLFNIAHDKIDVNIRLFSPIPAHAKFSDCLIFPDNCLLDIDGISNALLDYLMESIARTFRIILILLQCFTLLSHLRFFDKRSNE